MKQKVFVLSPYQTTSVREFQDLLDQGYFVKFATAQHVQKSGDFAGDQNRGKIVYILQKRVLNKSK